MIRDELRSTNRDGLLPAGAVLVGGGSRLVNICDYAKEILKIPVTVGSPEEVRGVSEKIKDPMYSTALGLMQYAFEEGHNLGGFNPFGGTVDKVRKIFKYFLP